MYCEIATSQNSPRKPPLGWGLLTWRNVACFCIPALLPHDCQYTQQSSTFSERMLRIAAAKDLGPLCPARPQRFPCPPSFRALTRTIYIPCLSRLKEYPRCLQPARVRPGQQAQPPTSTKRTPRIFCSQICTSFVLSLLIV